MVICCDTSFLFSVYGNDGNTEIAHAFLKNIRAPISVSLFNGFELANAFRLADFRRLIGKGDSLQNQMATGENLNVPFAI